VSLRDLHGDGKAAHSALIVFRRVKETMEAFRRRPREPEQLSFDMEIEEEPRRGFLERDRHFLFGSKIAETIRAFKSNRPESDWQQGTQRRAM
jgi:hypothetical protein